MSKRIDLTKPMKLKLMSEESGLYVFHATLDDELIAIVTVERKTVSLQTDFELPDSASRQITQAALDMLRKVVDLPAGDPDALREIKDDSKGAH